MTYQSVVHLPLHEHLHPNPIRRNRVYEGVELAVVLQHGLAFVGSDSERVSIVKTNLASSYICVDICQILHPYTRTYCGVGWTDMV